jgi:hypothetical protein
VDSATKSNWKRTLPWPAPSDWFSGCPHQEIGWLFLFKGLMIGTSSYFGVDSATKTPLPAPPGWFLWHCGSPSLLQLFLDVWPSAAAGQSSRGELQYMAPYWVQSPIHMRLGGTLLVLAPQWVQRPMDVRQEMATGIALLLAPHGVQLPINVRQAMVAGTALLLAPHQEQLPINVRQAMVAGTALLLAPHGVQQPINFKLR